MSKLTVNIIRIGVIIAITAVLALAVALANSGQPGSCCEVKIVVTDSLTRQYIHPGDIDTILAQAGIALLGQPMNTIDAQAIEALLNANDMIRQATCYKSPSNAVSIRIRQRMPKYRVAGESNYYVDEDRRVMPVNVRCAFYMPVATGHIDLQTATGELFDFVSYIDAHPFWKDQIEQVVVGPDSKVSLIPRVGSGTVILGRLDGYQQKLGKLERLYKEGFPKIGWPRYKTIDLQYKNQIVCRK